MLILLARAAGPHRAGRVMGLMGVALSLGPLLGPISGGIVLDSLSWRWMFLLSVPIGVLAALLALRAVPTDPPPEQRQRSAVRLDVLGPALLGPGFAAVVLALSQVGEQGSVAVRQAVAPLAAGALLLAGYAGHALAGGRKRRTPPVIDLRLFAHRGFAAAVTIMALGGLITFAAFYILPLYYQQAHGYGVLASGLLMAPVGIGGCLAMPLASRLSDRVGARGPATAGATLALLSALALTRIDAGTPEVWTLLASLTLGFGCGTYSSPTMGSLYRALPAAKVAQGSSVLYVLNQLGAALGVAFVALVMQTADGTTSGVHGVFWLTGAALVVLLATIPLLPGRPAAAPSTDAAPATAERASA